jgi:hypothetical protein
MILRHTIMDAKIPVLCLIACLLGSHADAQGGQRHTLTLRGK